MIESILIMIAVGSAYFITGYQFVPIMIAAHAAGLLGLAALIALLLRKKPRAKSLALRAAAFGFFFVVLYSGFKIEAAMARRGAVRIANAYSEYKEKKGNYPASSSDLVPDYIKSLPRAKRTIMWGHYKVIGEKVMFVQEPGLLAQSYNIATRKWHMVNAAEMFPVAE